MAGEFMMPTMTGAASVATPAVSRASFLVKVSLSGIRSDMIASIIA
jgi:hypothetical protein